MNSYYSPVVEKQQGSNHHRTWKEKSTKNSKLPLDILKTHHGENCRCITEVSSRDTNKAIRICL